MSAMNLGCPKLGHTGVTLCSGLRSTLACQTTSYLSPHTHTQWSQNALNTCLHVNAPTPPHPHCAPPKQAKGIEVNLFSLHFVQIPAHDFLTLGLPEPLGHSAFLTQAWVCVPGLRY